MHNEKEKRRKKEGKERRTKSKFSRLISANVRGNMHKKSKGFSPIGVLHHLAVFILQLFLDFKYRMPFKPAQSLLNKQLPYFLMNY